MIVPNSVHECIFQQIKIMNGLEVLQPQNKLRKLYGFVICSNENWGFNVENV